VAPTLLDVAMAAGVSQATASRVLNGSTRKVAGAFRERVLAAAAELGYTANLSAQATARGTSSVIALLVADIADPYFGQIASGVARGADEVGLVVTIAITERDHEREVRLVRTLRGLHPHALILAASRGSEPAPGLLHELEAFTAAGGRVVALGPGAGEARAVTVDNLAGGVGLGAALAGLGYRRAVVLAASHGVHSSDDRVAGFTRGFTGGGGEVLRVHHSGYTREAGHAAMQEALAAGVEPGTVVFGVSDMVAVGAMAAAREAGRTIGTDIAVAGFDDTPTGRDVSPSLTTVHIPLEELGYQATRAAVDHDWQHAPARLELGVVLRDSTPRLA
jgi:LacI family transcriptional regulator